MNVLAPWPREDPSLVAEPEHRLRLWWLQLVQWSYITRWPGILDPVRIWVTDRIKHLEARCNAKWLFRRAQRLGRVYVYGSIDVSIEGSVQLGDRILFPGGPIRTVLRCMEGAEITVGSGTDFNYGAAVTAHEAIVIGERCMIGSRVLITDRTSTSSGPVQLENDVWLAHGAVVLPGVRIGRGSAVAAGTVVTMNVPPNSLVIGTPARCVSLRSVGR